MSLHDRALDEGDVDALQRLIESQPAYAVRLTGHPPGPSDALSALIGVPADFDVDGKRALGLWDGATLVAFADVLVGHPDPHVAWVGLLMVHGRRQRSGLGRRLHRALDALVAGETGVELLRVGVVSTTAGESEPFWSALGYRPTGERRPYRYGTVEGTVRIWERRVSSTSEAG